MSECWFLGRLHHDSQQNLFDSHHLMALIHSYVLPLIFPHTPSISPFFFLSIPLPSPPFPFIAVLYRFPINHRYPRLDQPCSVIDNQTAIFGQKGGASASFGRMSPPTKKLAYLLTGLCFPHTPPIFSVILSPAFESTVAVR